MGGKAGRRLEILGEMVVAAASATYWTLKDSAMGEVGSWMPYCVGSPDKRGQDFDRTAESQSTGLEQDRRQPAFQSGPQVAPLGRTA
jgi:hypothetical protein